MSFEDWKRYFDKFLNEMVDEMTESYLDVFGLKVVFDDKKITMAQLIDALDNNFEGAEDILYLLKKAPKFGNDIDYVDNIVNDVICNLAD